MKWLAFLLLLTGCASQEYRWVRVLDFEPKSLYEWRVVSAGKLESVCGIHPPLVGACVPYTPGPLCVIFSNLSEDQARKMPADMDMNVWEHEMKHCAGWVHQRLGG